MPPAYSRLIRKKTHGVCVPTASVNPHAEFGICPNWKIFASCCLFELSDPSALGSISCFCQTFLATKLSFEILFCPDRPRHKSTFELLQLPFISTVLNLDSTRSQTCKRWQRDKSCNFPFHILELVQYRWVPLYPNVLESKKNLKYSQNYVSIPAVLNFPLGVVCSEKARPTCNGIYWFSSILRLLWCTLCDRTNLDLTKAWYGTWKVASMLALACIFWTKNEKIQRNLMAVCCDTIMR